MNISIQNRSRVLIGMNLLLFVLLLWQFHPVPDDRAQSHYVTSQATSIAISKIQYGLYDGYVGYKKVLNEFLEMKGDSDKGIPISEINQVIHGSLNLSDVASEGKHWMPCLPTWSDFVTAAFFIFSINIKSLFYLYMLLLLVSILTFIVAFRRNPEHLYLSLIVIATFIVVINSPAMMTMTRVSHRFWTYLAILPAFHIAILFIEKHERTRWNLVGTLIQSIVLVFIIHCRNVAIYELIFIFVAAPIYLFIASIIKSGDMHVLKSIIGKHRIWPLVVLLICLAMMAMYSKVRLYPDYSKIKTGYPFWHMIYISLSAHPDACAKYNICTFSDAVAYRLVEKQMGITIDGESNVWDEMIAGVKPEKMEFVVFFSPVYADILKKEVFRVIRNDPWLFVSSFYYKLIKFPEIYLKGVDGIGGYISAVHPFYGRSFSIFSLRWLLVFTVVTGFFLAKRSVSNCWYGNISIVFLMFISSFIMLLMAYPHYSTIMDPAFTLTSLIYIGISLLLYNFCSLMSMTIKHMKLKCMLKQ